MSGAVEGVAGLALSTVSVAALFTTCIQCFDIIVAGKNFSEDYEQLCTLVSALNLISRKNGWRSRRWAAPDSQSRPVMRGESSSVWHLGIESPMKKIC
jgi:hypothetical protein